MRNSILFDSNWKQSCDVPSLSIVEGLYAQMVDISCHNGASSSARIHKSATLALLGLEQDEDTQRFFRAPSGSPATNNGLSWCPSVDQNGGMRSSVCDLGAIEVHSNLILLPWSQSGGL
ncbi:MAG: choice-of-anchor Q domain-containing protein [Myxococcota bacterium]